MYTDTSWKRTSETVQRLLPWLFFTYPTSNLYFDSLVGTTSVANDEQIRRCNIQTKRDGGILQRYDDGNDNTQKQNTQNTEKHTNVTRLQTERNERETERDRRRYHLWYEGDELTWK